jgi:hypothetical protein
MIRTPNNISKCYFMTITRLVMNHFCALDTSQDSLDGESANHKAVFTNNSVALVRERTIPTGRPSLAGDVSANFCG